MDFVTIENGEIKLIEVKSSSTAPLTQNQKKAHPQIEKTGGIIKGNKGNEVGLPDGTHVSPRKVEMVRPNKLED